MAQVWKRRGLRPFMPCTRHKTNAPTPLGGGILVYTHLMRKQMAFAQMGTYYDGWTAHGRAPLWLVPVSTLLPLGLATSIPLTLPAFAAWLCVSEP